MEYTTTTYNKLLYTVIYRGEIIASHVQAYLFCELYMAIKENPQMTRSILFYQHYNCWNKFTINLRRRRVS